MRTSKLLLALLVFAALPAAAQVNDTYIIPAAANAGGANNTRWMTSFSVFNPHLDYPLTISITFIPTGGARGFEELVDVPANSLAVSDNLLAELFNTGGTGSLLVAAFPEDNPGVDDDMLARSFLVTSNTYNNDPRGTYGQTIPGVWAGLMNFSTDKISSIAHGIRHSARNGWRTNVGAVNLGRCNVNLLVSVYDADGNTLLDQAPMALPPLAHMQQPLPVEVEAGTIEFFVSDPCAADDDLYAVVFPYTSTIDAFSGDPTYQSPTLLAPASSILAKSAALAAITPGKKIDVSYARAVRAAAEHLGKARLQRTERGLQIVK
ncbi:MAG TPA: hypothetical protein VF824_18940 [Thermoanaerobaculia bacterium]